MKLESVTTEQLMNEQRRREQREIIRARQEERLLAAPIDTTGDLFDQYYAENPLFATPTREHKA